MAKVERNVQRNSEVTSIDLNVDESRLMDFRGAAIHLCTTERHVRRLWQERRIAAVKVGRRTRFTEADLEEFIAKNRCGALR